MEKKSNIMKRYFINAPSTLQQDHQYHTLQVLGPEKLDDKNVRVWPNSGPVISMVVCSNTLAQDWQGHDDI